MGVEFHITRAEEWWDNESKKISAEEWLAYVKEDPELSLDKYNGKHHALWNGPSAYEEPWLDWQDGNIFTKWPDTALFKKMLQVAKALNAHVQDDECRLYIQETDWEYNP